MVYIEPEEVRILIGLPSDPADPNYVSESLISYYLEMAHPLFLDSITVQLRDDRLEGALDGVNTTFRTSKQFIADTDFDFDVDSSDVTVYGWTGDDPTSKEILEVESVYWRDGIIVLSSPPVCDRVTADYRYYLYEPDHSLFKICVAYLTGWLLYASEYMEIPETQRLGAMTFRYSLTPSQRCRRLYFETLNILRRKVILGG